MPALVDVLSPEEVRLGARVSSKRQLLSEIAQAAAAATQLDARTVLMALNEREQLGSTGVGQGVALPHARLAGLDGLHALFWLLHDPIDFEALDDAPVDIVFVLLVPDGAETLHLKTLAKVARRLRDPAIRRELRACDEPAAAWRILTKEDDRSAAA
jgi:PTS system nitrogen regulatory IIA component